MASGEAAPESQAALMAGEAQHRDQPQDNLPPPSPPRTGEVPTNLEGLDMYAREEAQTIVNIEEAEGMGLLLQSVSSDIDRANESLTLEEFIITASDKADITIAPTATRTISSRGIISGMTEQHEGHDLILPAYHHLVKDKKEAWTPDEHLVNQKSPLGNNILHTAAWYGPAMVDKVIQGAPGLVIQLVTQQNLNGDTPLHVAARAGHFSAFQNLFPEHFDIDLLIRSTNKKGNTILHDALINKENETTIIRLFDPNGEGQPLPKHVYDVALEVTNEHDKSALYLATEMLYVEFVISVLRNCNQGMIPEGKSPLLAAILNRDKGMLETIIKERPEWIHLKDEEGRIPLHWAAAAGYLDGVDSLLEKCGTCRIVSDKMGWYALHLASEGGHVEVLKKLLSNCPAPWETVGSTGRNILHIAAARGKLGVVKHILRDPKLKIMINEIDCNGNTPLHLATLHSRPKVVYALTRNERVKKNLGQTNLRNQTALDINLEQVDGESQPLRQRLVWTALKSAGTRRSSMRILPRGPDELVLERKKGPNLQQFEDRINTLSTQGPDELVLERKKGANVQQFKDRIDTLIVVSTLIITATFAGGFSLPGESDNGVAANLKHTMFHFYIYCITISMYGATSVTLILIWARLGDISLLAHSLRLARPVLGITVVTLCLAFLAGVYVVISPLGWLATSFLIIATVGAVIVGLLYIVLWLPSSSSFIVCRYISYLPFHLLASWAGEDDDGDHHKSSKH